MINETMTHIWAKTSKDGSGNWHPLILHMLDVAASADAILVREPDPTREKMAEILGMNWEDARPWFLVAIGCHDLGKACPGFQCMRAELVAKTGMKLPRSPNTAINHAFVSQIALIEILKTNGWPNDLAELVADAVGCHHGERAKPSTLDQLEGDRDAIGGDDWKEARIELVNALMQVIKPARIPSKENLTGPEFMLLSGLTSFVDWIGSNEDWFPFGTVEDCTSLSEWFVVRRSCAEHALDAIGWERRTPLADATKNFEEVFDFTARPLQKAMSKALLDLEQPAIILLEAPMGEGKTEAAFHAHLELQRRFGHRGLYVALPTMATGNAMFQRTLKFLGDQGANRRLDLQLVHGGAMLNETFQELKISGIYDPETGGEIRAGEWFTSKKRALLSEYGVGTVDQALLPILPVRHNFVRLWGLANRVVIFDEIHAYDAYTGTLLIHLLRWLLALGSSIVLLSATLPPSVRRKLAGAVNNRLPGREPKYPRVSIFTEDRVRQKHFSADKDRRLTIGVKAISEGLPDLRDALSDGLMKGGFGLALVNTVQRAQELYCLFPRGEALESNAKRVGKRLADGTEVYLFHARFPAEWRQRREEKVRETFGPSSHREGRKLLIATQVAEQSLDLDFDLIATDLAPIDLILQRAGRLWRHKRKSRPVARPTLFVAGLAGNKPPSFGKPLWWEKVYREDMLLRSWILLHKKRKVTLPDEIDKLVQAVYEEDVEIPKSLQARMGRAVEAGEGESYSKLGQANQAIIGLPDDYSWNDPARFVLHDEDDPSVHRTLLAQTRLGEGVVAIPLYPGDEFDPEIIPDFARSKELFLQAVRLSRKNVVTQLKALGVPESWKKLSLLRNCVPMVFNEQWRWTLDVTVRLDEDLGFVYEPKEDE
jgi:CRISPR-associated endonuclease/helicase Cas3